jgi:hypothetical protein
MRLGVVAPSRRSQEFELSSSYQSTVNPSHFSSQMRAFGAASLSIIRTGFTFNGWMTR